MRSATLPMVTSRPARGEGVDVTDPQQLAAHAMDCRFECVPRATRVDATRQIVPPSPSQNNYSVTIANQPGSIDFTKHCEV